MNLKDNLDKDDMCFVCGEKNSLSLKMKFDFYESDKVKAVFNPGKELQGFKNFTHGGIVSTVLDEAMAKVVNEKKYRAVTAEMKTRFKEPVPIGKEYIVKGIFEKKHRNLLYTKAYLLDQEEKVLAKAEAKFMHINQK